MSPPVDPAPHDDGYDPVAVGHPAVDELDHDQIIEAANILIRPAPFSVPLTHLASQHCSTLP